MKLLHRPVYLSSRASTLTIIPFGCVHADDPGFSEDEWSKCVQEIRQTPDCYAVGCGDYKNFLRGTARKHLKSYVADEDSWRDLDGMVRREAEKFAEKWLRPIQHKLIGLAEGNHYYEFSSGGTDTQYLCQILDVPYLDKPCFWRMPVIYKSGKRQDTLKVLRVLIHHGDWSGGYTRIGGDINAAENKSSLGFPDFDIYIFSHTHRKYGVVTPSVTIPETGRMRLFERPRVVIRTGTFMRGYVEKCAGRYAEKKLLNPTAIGYVRLEIKFYRQYDPELYAEKKREMPFRKAKGMATLPIRHKFEVHH